MPGFTSWQDFDLKRRILTLARSIVGKYVWNGGKTGASEDEVALDSKLVSVLEDWQKRCVPTPEGWLFANEKSKRRANSRVAALVLPPAIKRQLKDRAKEVSLQNLKPETAANYGKPVDRGANT